MHIEIIGGVGSGKLALARALERHGFAHVKEEFESNPHLARFHKNPWSCAFAFGMKMLDMHCGQIAAGRAKNPDARPVFDFSLVTNEAYARTCKTLWMMTPWKGREFIEACRARRAGAPRPALRIVLDLSPEEQKARILKRGRAREKATAVWFLRLLKSNLDKVVASLDDGVPVLRIDAAKYDWVSNEKDMAEITRLVQAALPPAPQQARRVSGPGM